MSAQEVLPIAIVGLSCRFPGGANDPEKLWSILSEGRSAWSDVPSTRWNWKSFFHPSAVHGTVNSRGGHFIDQDVRAFDAAFFGIPPSEANAMDPQHRFQLETAYEALENAGISLDEIRGSLTSVYVALFNRDYDRMMFKDTEDIAKYHLLSSGEAVASNRISYTFDLKGPSMTIDTGCSGSLVALHQACQGLRTKEANMALVGGTSLMLHPDTMIPMSRLNILNSKGKCFVFDDRGSGYGRGEGVATVVLKRLEDAIKSGDHIRGIIRNTGVNQDGRTSGIALPSQDAQQALAQHVYDNAGIDPLTVSYIEAHGTGTVVGDLAETRSVAHAFCKGRDKDNPLFIGSIKANIGHLESASGVAGLIKAILVLERCLIPPHINLENWKKDLNLESSNIQVPLTLQKLPIDENGKARVSVNSFGYGGANAHAILETAYPKKNLTNGHTDPYAALYASLSSGNVSRKPLVNGYKKRSPTRIFSVTAKSKKSLVQVVENLQKWASGHINHSSEDEIRHLGNLAYTLNSRRSIFQWRHSFLASSFRELLSSSMQTISKPSKSSHYVRVAFLFTGQGAQWVAMAKELIHGESEFSRSLERSDKILRDLGASWSLIEELLSPESSSRINQSEVAQPATTAIQIALVDLLKSIKVVPSAVLGHSSGEIAAAFAAEILTQDMALKVSYHRSFLSSACKAVFATRGAMLAVGLGENQILPYISKVLEGKISIACINSNNSTTISGDEVAILELKSMLDRDSVFARRLNVDTAYHSHHMEMVADQYLEKLQDLQYKEGNPSIRFISSVTASPKVSSFGPSYWVENLVSKVRFSDALETLCHIEKSFYPLGLSVAHALVEIGPHSALSGPIRQTITYLERQSELVYLPSLIRKNDALHSVLDLSRKLFDLGYQVNLEAVNAISAVTQSHEVLSDLPPYSWDHSTMFWHESRLSQEGRLRSHPYHDLLGLRIVSGTPWRPSWRHIISIDALPWLSDHVVDGSVVFPGSGYLCMAIEGVSQLALDQGIEDSNILSYVIRNTSFSKSLVIPQPPAHVEVQMTLNPPSIGGDKSLTEWREFDITSFQDGIWKQHCSGSIKIERTTPPDELEGQREEDLAANCKRRTLQDLIQKCSETIQPQAFYGELRSLGNTYGPSFTAISELRIGDFHATATILTPDIEACMPSKFMQPHVIHPSTLDSVFQTGLPLYRQHCVPGPVMPIFIQEVTISTMVSSDTGSELFVGTSILPTGPRSASMSALVFQKDEHSSIIPVVTLSTGELKGLGDTYQSSSENPTLRNFTYSMDWGIDASFLTTKEFQRFSPTADPDAMRKSRRQIMNTGASLYIKKFLDQIESKPLLELKDHYVFLVKWMEKYVQSDKCRNWIAGMSEQEISAALSQVPEAGVEGQFLDRIGGNLLSIISGLIDPLSLMLEDNLLQRFYLHDCAIQCSAHLVNYLRLLSFKNPKLKALEIGAGTGGTTMPILQGLVSPKGSAFSKYDFTDISAGFFESARSRFQDWSNLLTFKTLDIERDPVTQGFEEASYDIVIASNVLHATKYIDRTLENVRRLLKPGGKLVLVEITQMTPFDNITFGLLSGWWAGIDDGRLESPLMSVQSWTEALNRTSFNGVEILASDFKGSPNWYDFMATTYLPQSNVLQSHVQILNSPSVGEKLSTFSEDLRSELLNKKFCVSISQWPVQQVDTPRSYVIIDSTTHPLLSNPTQEEFRQLTSLVTGPAQILWISASENGSLNAETGLVTGFARVARNENMRLKFVTLDIQQSLPSRESGIFQTIANILRNFGPSPTSSSLDEFEYAYYDDQIHIPRLIPDDKLNNIVTSVMTDSKEPGIFRQAQRPLKLNVDTPGLLDSLVFTDDDTKGNPLGVQEVEVEVQAIGVNFKDVFIALGQMKTTDQMVGECAGIISSVGSGLKDRFQLGDRVWVLTGTPYANFTRADGCSVYHMPDTMSFVTAASIPVVFATAYYGLVTIAHLQKGQTVLIHAASGGVGQAALMIAQSIGAEIFATVSSVSKSQLLVEQFKIPQSHIFSSQKKTFRKGVERLTNGKGVDVVLNSLSGEVLQETWQCVAPMGTFVEIGKTDIYRKGQLAMEPFDKNITFASVDLMLLLKHQPEKLQPMFENIAEMFNRGEYKPVHPIMKMPIGDIQQAFRLIQARKHTGKIVLDASDPSPITVTHPPRVPLALEVHGTYIIAGGLGGLGRDIAKFMASHGARNLAILSRRGSETAKAVTLSHELQSLGACVKFVSCDISNHLKAKEAVADVLKSMPPVRGVIQAAMVLQDRTLEKMDATDLKVALDPKVSGTINLLSALEGSPLDFFMMLSSCSTILGNSTQANYSAACSFQDTLAQFNSRKLSSTRFISLNLGLIEDSESIKEISERALNLMREGSYIPVKLHEVLALLESYMGESASTGSHAQIAIGFDKQSLTRRGDSPKGSMFNHLPDAVDNKQLNHTAQVSINVDEKISAASDLTEAFRILTKAVATKLCALVGTDSDSIDLDSPIMDLGLDSLIAIELKNWINRTLQAALTTSEIFDSASLRLLGKAVSERSALITKYREGLLGKV